MKPTPILLIVTAALFCSSISPLAAAPSKPVVELLEWLAKRGGKLSPQGTKALEQAVARHGEEALRAFREGGTGLAEASARHGDEVVRAAIRVPEASAALARRADELLPLVRSHGDDVLRLEAKAPGLAADAVRVYSQPGDIGRLARLNSDDAARTISFAGRAKDPAVARELLHAVEKQGPGVLERLPSTKILAYGLTSAMIVAATGVSFLAPEAVASTIDSLVSKVGTGVAAAIVAAAVVALGWLSFLILPWLRLLRPRRQGARPSSGR